MLRVLQVKILINNIYLKYQESILCQLVTIKNHIISQHPESGATLISFVNVFKNVANLPQSKQQQTRQKKKQCDIFEIANPEIVVN